MITRIVQSLDHLSSVKVAGHFKTVLAGSHGIFFHAIHFLESLLNIPGTSGTAIVNSDNLQCADLARSGTTIVLDRQSFASCFTMEAAHCQGIESLLSGGIVRCVDSDLLAILIT